MAKRNDFHQSALSHQLSEDALTDQQLLEKFKYYGARAMNARNKCIGLLPEIHRRELFRRHGYESIYEFASKLAGLSHEQVNRVINLEQRLQDKPDLHAALVKGEIGVNKLRKVISIVTLENQAEVAETVRTLSVRAVETLVRDQKVAAALADARPGDGEKIRDGHVTMQKTMFSEELQLDPEVQKRLLDMQKKGLDINKLLKEFLQKHQEVIEAEKNRIAENLPSTASSHYVPARVKNVLLQEFGKKCSVPECYRPAETLHHTRRFALVASHDPRFMAPLCVGHHELAHRVDGKVQRHRKINFT